MQKQDDVKILISERLYLRYFKKEDAAALYDYRSLEEIAQYQYWEPYTIEQAVAFVEQCITSGLDKEGKWIGLAIVDPIKEKLIGDCALWITGQSAEIGCNISPEYQKQGFAKETLLLLVDYCMKFGNIREVFGITDSQNVASIRLMKSIGMEKEPDFEEKVMCKGILSVEHKYCIKLEEESSIKGRIF